jgi:hypothetical protein
MAVFGTAAKQEGGTAVVSSEVAFCAPYCLLRTTSPCITIRHKNMHHAYNGLIEKRFLFLSRL